VGTGSNLSGFPTNQELAASPAQDEAFRRTVEVARGAVVGQGTATHRNAPVSKIARYRACSVLMSAGRKWLAREEACDAQIVSLFSGLPQSCVPVVLREAAMYQKATGLSEGESGLASLEYNVLLRSSGAGGGRGTVFAAPRFVAVRHKLEIVEPSSGLTKSIEAVVAFCGTLQCEVLSSSITNETRYCPNRETSPLASRRQT